MQQSLSGWPNKCSRNTCTKLRSHVHQLILIVLSFPSYSTDLLPTLARITTRIQVCRLSVYRSQRSEPIG